MRYMVKKTVHGRGTDYTDGHGFFNELLGGDI